ncbi:MAG: glycosyl transferase, partial [Bacteroidota bacterium]
PLWNWILASSFFLWGETTEWTARFPTVVALLSFAYTTYWFSHQILGKKLAILHALTVITCGRMLFWDSMLALIDVCFSWVVYSQIMLLYHYGKKGQWWQAFGWAYLLCAVGFLLKGLPAIVFTGLTILALLW